MNWLKLISISLGFLLSAQFAAAETYVRGAIAGNCTMQADANFSIAHNGAIDSSGAKLANVPEGNGGATWPITVCPNKGSNTAVECAAGWKPILQSVVQMDCRSGNGAARCFTYWIINSCAKL